VARLRSMSASLASMAATGIDLLLRVNHPRLRVLLAVPGAGGPSRSWARSRRDRVVARLHSRPVGPSRF
jgi:hypothetical protein